MHCTGDRELKGWRVVLTVLQKRSLLIGFIIALNLLVSVLLMMWLPPGVGWQLAGGEGGSFSLYNNNNNNFNTDNDIAIALEGKPLHERLRFLSGEDGERMRLRAGDPLPVHDDPALVLYDNHPVAPTRPQGFYHRGFEGNPEAQQAGSDNAVLTIITITKNPTEKFLYTRQSVFMQSLQLFRWIIMNDHTDSIEGYRMLEETAAMDSRVQLVNNTATEHTYAVGRNIAVGMVRTRYWVNLDDDDMFELNAVEKCVWFLDTNEEMSICGGFLVAFGELNYTWVKGLHSGIRPKENYFCISMVVRQSAQAATGCRFREEFNGGAEDWDFWLCMIEHGHWGATIPESVFWYRRNPTALRQQRWPNLHVHQEEVRSLIHTLHYNVTSSTLPHPLVRPTEINSPIPLTLPFLNPLRGNDRPAKSILVAIPWMHMGGADFGNIRIVRQLHQEGYRITILTTIHSPPESNFLRPYFSQFTHDIFVLPAFLRVVDAPRFVLYLIHSRQISTVFLSNCQLLYDILPALRAAAPWVTFLDYIHNEDMSWRSGGFPTLSLINQDFLDRTLVCSDYMKRFMVERGADEAKIARAYLGVPTSDFRPLPSAERGRLRQLLGFAPHEVVIIDSARITEQKRPLLALDAIKQAAQLAPGYAIRFIMAGTGDLVNQVHSRIAELGLEDTVTVLGHVSQNATKMLLDVGDIFFLPSRIEGIALALAEAMAMGIPFLSSAGGGQMELMPENREGWGDFVGLIPSTSDHKADTRAHAEQLAILIRDPALRRKIGEQARERIMELFDADTNMQQISTELVLAAKVHAAEVAEDAALVGMRKRKRATLARKQLHEISSISEQLDVDIYLPNIHHGINNALQGGLTDMHDIQMKMIDPTAWPYSFSAVRRVCPDKSADDAAWVAAVAQGSACEPEARTEDLIISAMHEQCYQWCVFDITTTELVGWIFHGNCFSQFDNTHFCAKDFPHLKPK